NPVIKAADGLWRIWNVIAAHDPWPMTNTSFWFEWRLWKYQSTGYHVTNLLLHIGDALLIAAILRRLSIPGAWLAALLFAVHPVNVESVAWIAQRKNLLAMSFFLLSILFFVELEVQRPPSGRALGWTHDRRYWLSLAAFVFAMLSKASVGVLP